MSNPEFGTPEFEEMVLAQLEEEARIRKSVTAEEAARRYMPPVLLDPAGTPRFRENPFIRQLLKSDLECLSAPSPDLEKEFQRMLDPEGGNAIVRWLAQPENAGKRTLNDIAIHGGWSQEDQECFAMLIGYSVGGAGDLSFFSDAMLERASEAAKSLREKAKTR